VEEVRLVLSFDGLLAKLKKQGQQRAAVSTCMTCVSKARFRDASHGEEDRSLWHYETPKGARACFR
jgi:hypothetical protein